MVVRGKRRVWRVEKKSPPNTQRPLKHRIEGFGVRCKENEENTHRRQNRLKRGRVFSGGRALTLVALYTSSSKDFSFVPACLVCRVSFQEENHRFLLTDANIFLFCLLFLPPSPLTWFSHCFDHLVWIRILGSLHLGSGVFFLEVSRSMQIGVSQCLFSVLPRHITFVHFSHFLTNLLSIPPLPITLDRSCATPDACATAVGENDGVKKA